MRLLPVFPLMLALSVLPAYAAASPRVVAQASSKQPLGSVYLSRGLVPGHTYRVDVAAQGRHSFGGSGFEYLLYIQSGRLGTLNKSLKISGTTPHSFTVRQPMSSGVNAWSITLMIQLKSGRGLAVKLLDMGRHR